MTTARVRDRLTTIVPGVALCMLVAVAALGIATAETRLLGHPVVEGLVVAILLGMVVRTVWTPSDRLDAGIRFAAKDVLEVAVVLLGLTADLPLLLAAGPALALGIVVLVVVGLALSYALGRWFGLPSTLAILVACGNAICGNSAIAAVAPVIGADPEHVASAIAFTAIFGVGVVIGLPLLIHPLGLSFYQYGVLSGLTVYAVPQVLAATFPVSMLSGQVGTLVKLVRVLMLGPVVLFFALRQRRVTRHSEPRPSSGAVATVPWRVGRVTDFVPWFIIGFLLLAALRSFGVAPLGLIEPARLASVWLTVVAMAAMGLGCDVRTVARAGGSVVLTVTGSLVVLVLLGLGLIHGLGIR